MLIGTADPLEGSILILAGLGLVGIGARRTASRHRRLIAWAFVLVAGGVGALWWLSALGGVGGDTGRSSWWALVLIPYAAGWLLGLAGAIRVLRESTPSLAVADERGGSVPGDEGESHDDEPA
jgi:hypothetical protein